jgi:hypothetical protein
MNSEHGSGESDDQIKEKAHAIYKQESKGNKTFTFEYWWKHVRFEQKWPNRPENQYRTGTNKRVKHNESGANTSSSNHESEDPELSERTRLKGQKKARERLKGKEKKSVDELSLEKLRTKKM